MNRRTFIAAAGTAGVTLNTGAIALAQSTDTATPAAPAPKTGYVDVNGVHMYYEIHGQGGTPLVLLHGAFSAIGTSFGALLPELAKSREMIAFELQAHGHTADIDRPMTVAGLADDVAKAVAQLGFGKVDVLGYSLGGAVALELAIHHQDLVRKLVALAVAFNKAGFQPGMAEGMAGLKPEMMVGSPWHSEYMAIAPRPEDFSKLFARVMDLNTNVPDVSREDIASIAAPTLLVYGDADISTPEHQVEFLRLLGGGTMGDTPAGLPKAWLAVLPGTSHSMIPARADLMASFVPRFLDV
jgi:pimeloyl-ACP methyl ester carboxylesterase